MSSAAAVRSGARRAHDPGGGLRRRRVELARPDDPPGDQGAGAHRPDRPRHPGARHPRVARHAGQAGLGRRVPDRRRLRPVPGRRGDPRDARSSATSGSYERDRPGPRRAAPRATSTPGRRSPGRSRSPRRPRNNGELALSTLLVLLGVYLVIGAGGITIPGSSNTVGPRFFPYLVGAATIVVGGLLAFRVLRGDQGPRGGRRGRRPRREDLVAGRRDHRPRLPRPRPPDQRDRLAAGGDADVRGHRLGPRRARHRPTAAGRGRRLRGRLAGVRQGPRRHAAGRHPARAGDGLAGRADGRLLPARAGLRRRGDADQPALRPDRRRCWAPPSACCPASARP